MDNDVRMGLFWTLATLALIGGVILLSGCSADTISNTTNSYVCNLTYEMDNDDKVVVRHAEDRHGKPLKMVTVSGTCLMPNGTSTVTIK